MAMPPGINPHDGRELELMLRGTKKFAVFAAPAVARDSLPDASFAPHVATGRFLRREFTSNHKATGTPMVTICFALAGEGWRVDALRSLQALPRSDEQERQIGRLLGYTAEEIAAYLEYGRQLRQA
ncbi:hypothetical protein [Ferrovibrio sp.]|uniref:hypothetical protein n=1 Tax=Ferrovibrio sp. TaxID=1917215 RepID=UPI003D0EB100